MFKFTFLSFFLVTTLFLCSKSFSYQHDGVASLDLSSFSSPFVVKKDQRTPIVATEFGEISAVHIGDGYHIQFITLEPNSFLLPLLLHSDMVLFIHTGSGILNWIDEDKERTLDLRRGDIFRLRSGTVFYLHSNLVSERDKFQEKLRVYAIFDVGECLYEPCLGAYSEIRDLVLGFNERTLRTTFAVPEEVLGKLRNAAKPPLITSALPRSRTQLLEEDTWQTRLVKLFVRAEDVTDHLAMNRKKESNAYNVFDADSDFENVNGRSIVVDEKDMDALKGSSVGVFMVNLTKGSMMGPHWNPSASEISIVLKGAGIVRVVNQPSSPTNKSERFMVEEGDVFVVPQFYPMTQMSFENSSFVFMGFSTSAKANYPQFLVGQSSVLNVVNREVLSTSFNLRNKTIERLLGGQNEGVILECVSCAEVELTKLMREIEERKRREEEEIERKRKAEEEERKRQEEEAKRREEEEIERRRKEEEEARKREEEAAKRREEEIERRKKEAEEARKREEERKIEEEEAKKREEERRRREKQEQEARKREEEREREEEEEAKRQEEERIRREKEEEEAREREEEREKEEEMAKRQEEERQREAREETERKRREEEARKREEEREKEEEIAKRQEEERQRKAREEVERKRREEQEIKKHEEEARKREEQRQEEEEIAKKQEEERQHKAREDVERKRREEQEIKKREEEARKREEERKKEEEMAKRAEEERQRKEREEAERERREEQERKRSEEEATKREEERKSEEAAAERAEEERQRREEEEEKQRSWPPQPQPPIIVRENVPEEDES